MSRFENIFGRLFRGAFPPRRDPFAAEAARRRPAATGSLVTRFERASVRLFRNNCHVLPWVREREELDASVQGARADLMRSWNVYRESVKARRAAARADSDWRQVVSAFRRQTADINRRIAAYNLKAPSAAFRKQPLDADRELARVMSDA